VSRATDKYKLTNQPLTTWLNGSQAERFRAIAKAHGVSPAMFLRAIVMDALADEVQGFSLYLSPTGEAHYYAHLRVKTHGPSPACVSDNS
jgi:hypothetical protein